VAQYLRTERPGGVVVSIPCHIQPDEAWKELNDLRHQIDPETLLLCVAPIPEVFARIDSIPGLEVCSTFRDLAELIDTNRT